MNFSEYLNKLKEVATTTASVAVFPRKIPFGIVRRTYPFDLKKIKKKKSKK